MTMLYKDPDLTLKPRGAVGGIGYSNGMVCTFYTGPVFLVISTVLFM